MSRLLSPRFAAQAAEFLPNVLVVVPTLNEARRVADVVDALLEQPANAAELRVVVVDGGSSDATVTIVEAMAARRPGLSVLHNPARLQSAAVNLAARELGLFADVLVRCDAHATYPPRFVERLLSALAAHRADAVVVPLVSRGESALQRAVAWVSNSPVGTGGSAHRGARRSGFVDHGHHAAFRMDAFRRAGGYDETFSHNEDAELDCRQRAVGSRLFLDAENPVTYHPRATLWALARQYFNYGAGRSRTLRRHPSSVRARQLVVPLNALLLAGGLLCGAARATFLAWPIAYATLLVLVSVHFTARERSLAGLWTGPVAAAMHLGWAAGFFTGLLRKRERRWTDGVRPATGSEPGAYRVGEGEPMHVLAVDPSLFTAPYDAALTRGLVAAGVRPLWAVRPVRPGDRPELAEPFVEEIFYRKTDRLVRLPRRLRALAKGIEHVVGLCELVRLVAATKPAVVHFQWLVVPWLDALAISVVRRMAPVVVTVHDTKAWNGDSLGRLQTWGADLPLGFADKLIVHTRAGHAALCRRGFAPERVVVIPHGPMALGGGQAARSRPRDTRFTFVAFGELKPYKGLDILIEALGSLPPELRSRTRAVVAGRPMMDLEPLRARIAELGLASTVEIRAWRQSEAEMAELFDDADCFVFPYRQIDASGVYYLVKDLSKWLIASNVGIFAEDVQDGVRGTLVPPEDPHALASAMTLALTLRYRPCGPTSQTTWESIGESTRAVYAEVTAARAARPTGAVVGLSEGAGE
ncbi:MAG TPA: glycosyltransferase [Polyangiaceae bacterium]|nr:glycosyltransferase [Polyangiaceae bacterium]